ncbi:MAG: NAD(P)H-hydrate dehydratase [Rubellimicrobium sp.]|nr:NAD(P)H-hydrate dehydratase [Rubellimicrobium sp.]
MDELLTMAQMRACEDAAIASGAAGGAGLMERAGAAVVGALAEAWPGLRPGSALVLCGPGNNGGDGHVIARLLVQAGWRVRLLAHGDPARQGADATLMRRRWAAIGDTGPLDAEAVAAALPVDLVVDAVFGAGAVREMTGDPAGAFALLARRRDAAGKVVAVDAPSGLCLDSGFYPGCPRAALPDTALRADLTVTFHRARPGQYLGHGPDVCGRLHVADIGLTGAPEDAMRRVAVAPGSAGAAALDKGQGHKFSHGAVLVVSGPAQGSGAARLAARAALRIGAGLVTLGAAPGDLATLAPALEAVMLRGLEDGAALAAWLEADPRITALCIGPGLGTGPREAGLVAAALRARRPVVLDADALTLLARQPGLRALLHPACVLTPHEGEFARLAPDLVAASRPGERAPLPSRADAARALARRLGVSVLLKGRASVIAEPQGRVRLHAAAYDRAAPWLATAGAGDVLAGLIAGLLARGVAPPEAAALAAFVHVEAARAFGPGLIASDLPDLVPQALARIAAG